MKYIIVLIILNYLISNINGYHPDGWVEEEIPNPIYSPRECGRFDRVGLICDPDQILTYEQGNYLQTQLDEIYNTIQTTCNNNNYSQPIGIVIVQKMNLLGQPKEQVAKHIAEYIDKQWKIGNSNCLNEIIIFLSIQDRYLYILTGEKVKYKLTKSIIERIRSNHMNPYFQQQNYYQGLMDGLWQIKSYLQETQQNNIFNSNSTHYSQLNDSYQNYYNTTGNAELTNEDAVSVLIFVGIIIGLFLLFGILNKRKNQRSNNVNSNNSVYNENYGQSKKTDGNGGQW